MRGTEDARSPGYLCMQAIGRSLSFRRRRKSSAEKMATGDLASRSETSSSATSSPMFSPTSQPTPPQDFVLDEAAPATSPKQCPKKLGALRRSLSFGRTRSTNEDNISERCEPAEVRDEPRAHARPAETGLDPDPTPNPEQVVMRRVNKYIPIYTAFTNVPTEVLAVQDVDPGRLQCKLYGVDGPRRIVRCHELRFVNPEDLESYIQQAQRCSPNDRHHRCTCCLEWIYSDAVRCATCSQPLHPHCAEAWLERSHNCPSCRSEWVSETEVETHAQLAVIRRLRTQHSGAEAVAAPEAAPAEAAAPPTPAPEMAVQA